MLARVMAIVLVDYDRKARGAVTAFWETREKARLKRLKAEAVHDFQTAYGEGVFGKHPQPPPGWMMLFEDAPESWNDQRSFTTLPGLFGAARRVRFEALRYSVRTPLAGATIHPCCSNLFAALGREWWRKNTHSEATGFTTFITPLAGHVAAEAVSTTA